MKNHCISFILLSGILFALSTTAFAAAVRAPTRPLKERVQGAETVFLGKVVNKVVEGDWARAELLVKEPLRDAKEGAKVEVIWRIRVGNMFIYDVAEGTSGVAILSDKHEGRYWLRSDKFEDPKKIEEVKALIEGDKEAKE